MRPRIRNFCKWILLPLSFLLCFVAFVMVPNLLNAVQRGRQKRSMADLRAITTALDEYGLEHKRYPKAPSGTVDTLREALEPNYVKALPLDDAWRHRFGVQITKSGYLLWSNGADGQPDVGPRNPGDGIGTTNFDQDIVVSNGEFIQYPEGI